MRKLRGCFGNSSGEGLGSIIDSFEISCGVLNTYWSTHRDVNRVHDAWFSDMEAVRASVGIQEDSLPGGSAPRPKEVGDLCQEELFSRNFQENTHSQDCCQICYETLQPSTMRSCGCAHFFCDVCWGGYIKTAIDGGPSSLDLRCPDPKCSAAVSIL